MSAGFEKSVVVEEKGDRRFEVTYKGLADQWQRFFGIALFFCIAPISCVNISYSKTISEINQIFLWVLIFAGALWGLFRLSKAEHKIEITPDGLKFSGKTVPYSEIDSVGCEGNQVYIICSGTRVQLGDAQDNDIANAVIGKITKHSSVKFS